MATEIEQRFGRYGGRYVPETLMPALAELEREWAAAREDPEYRARLDGLLATYVGRPSPLYRAERLSERVGSTVFLKREDLLHTGAHKINNALGQALLAQRMGKPRVIAETGAGQHGVAAATACALLGLECVVYMGTEDMRRQAPNVERMGLLGASVEPVEAGARTLKEAVSAAIRDWVTNVATTHYVIGSAVGPAPYPALVRDLQRVIGDEARTQIQETTGRLPDRVVACVGGGSNASGTFAAFVVDEGVGLVGVEAAGEGLDGRHGASLAAGREGVLHGALSSVLQDEDGQILEAHSISAGLDYPGVGPEHAHLRDTGRVHYVSVTDDDAVGLVGVEAAGEGLDGRHGASLAAGREGVLHGALSSVLQDEDGQILEAHSISAGLDYPGVGPEHAHLRDTGRVQYVSVTDDDAVAAFKELSRLEGIIPALEPSHAIAWVLANPAPAEAVTLVTLSGRGDKDLAEVLSRDG